MDRAIVLLSGGLDSAVTLWWAKSRGWDLRPLTFDYFGRPKREHEAIRALTERVAVRYIVGGHNGIDPESFPDSSPKFFNFLNSVFHLSLWSYEKAPVQILVPLSGKSKEEVVRMGLAMGVPFEVTWSCYWDRAVHCGTCASCQERREAFAKVGVEDPVAYEA